MKDVFFALTARRRAPRSKAALRLASALTLGFAAAAAGGGQAQAQGVFEKPVVIELFTSQGCSSCPPADRLLAKLARQPNVIALSFSVDYWDYIGWKDTFASPAYTARQKGYAAARGDGHVYTPQAIVNGLAHVVGSDYSAIRSAARQLYGRKGALQVAIATRQRNGALICDVGAGQARAPQRAGLWLYRILSARDVQIGRGENRGRKVTYVNIVRSVQKIGEWTGKAARFEIPDAELKKDGAEGWVLMLQVGQPHRPRSILGAAKAAGF